MKPRLFFLLILVIQGCHSKKELRSQLICSEIFSDSAITEMNAPKAAAEPGFLWPHPRDMGLPLLVKFLNGTAFQKGKVMQYAAIWDSASATGWNGRQNIHKINLLFVSDNYPPRAYTDVRILFRPGGSQSAVGSDCKRISQDDATTVFGWVDENHSEDDIRSVILHELGHVLGLIHEHQNPSASIPWNKEKVYQYYHDTQDPPWDHAKVDENIFKLYNASTTNYTKFDSLSIMCYAIPPIITYGGYTTPWNTNLSKTDIEFIKRIYPYEPCIPGETCCFDKKGHRIPCP